jgi:flagellar protein FliL
MVKSAATSQKRTMAPPEAEPIGGRIIPALFLLIVTLAAAGAGGVLMLKPATAHTGGASTRMSATVQPTYASMPAMSFTLRDGDRLRELKVRVVLELDPSVPLETVKPYLPHIADAMSVRMLDVDPNELSGQDGPHYIKDALGFAANKAIRPLKIRQVLVQDMLLR